MIIKERRRARRPQEGVQEPERGGKSTRRKNLLQTEIFHPTYTHRRGWWWKKIERRNIFNILWNFIIKEFVKNPELYEFFSGNILLKKIYSLLDVNVMKKGGSGYKCVYMLIFLPAEHIFPFLYILILLFHLKILFNRIIVGVKMALTLWKGLFEKNLKHFLNKF